MVVVAVDAMGSDAGPSIAAEAAASLVQRAESPELLLVGDERELRRRILWHNPEAFESGRLRILDAPRYVAQEDKPAEALRARPDASILVAARAVREGKADVLVSAGNTGAVTLACAQIFERLPGVQRTALGAVYPTERRRGEKDDPFSLILDAGLTLEATAHDLVAFGIMGAAYAARISRNPRPRVALLSIGHEPNKGPAAIVEAYGRLAAIEGIEFIGNIEGTDIPRGTADVVVTAGFTGNIVLKMLEGVAETAIRLGRYAGDRALRYKLGLGLLAPALGQLKRATDWQEYGGVPILGFDHLCIKAHGRSTARALRNAILVASRGARTDLVEATRAGLRVIADDD